jgi:hypothetical protein
LATGHNPGERERRRWATLRLEGRQYRPGDTPADVHLDMRASPKVTLRNLVRSPEVWAEHATCSECCDILAAADRGDAPLMSDEQWQAFRRHR